MMTLNTVCMLLFVCLVKTSAANQNIFYKREFRIPNKIFDGNAEKVCTAQRVEAGQYFVKFDPHIEEHGVINHLSLALCDEPFSDKFIWPCEGGNYCKSLTEHREGIFTWGREATAWTLPDDTGIPVGDKPKYILMLVHSSHLFNSTDMSQSGVDIYLRNTEPTYKAGLAIMGSTGRIPPHVTDYTTDSACEWTFDTRVSIFAFTIHTHARGKAVAAYINRNEIWYEIGRGNPQFPEQKINVTHKKLHIEAGDQLASRCTFDAKDDRYVPFSHLADDEMCNFIIHYSYEGPNDESLRYLECSADAETFHLTDHFSAIPADSKNSEISPDQQFYVKRDHWKKTTYYA